MAEATAPAAAKTLESGLSDWSGKPLREAPKDKRRQVMAKLWIRMATLFTANRWREAAPESVMGDWEEVLGTISARDVARGIEKLQAETPKYVPGAAEFRRMCREVQPGTYSGGQPRPLPPLAKLLEGASVSGSARAYIDMCNRLTRGERLTRAELAGLPPCYLAGGDMIKPVDFCVALEDEQ